MPLIPTLHRVGRAGILTPVQGVQPKPIVISGVTRDNTGATLGSCVVDLFRTMDDVKVDTTTSDVSGNFFFYTVSGGQYYYAVAYKTGSPDVAGTTRQDLVGI